ncbi:MAG TPA: PAS domain-containing protein [Rhizomicrobium sp.]|jgi:hypothetical protein
MQGQERDDYWSEPLPPEFLPADSVEDENLRFLLAHWRGLRGARPWPARADISPKALKQCLRVIHLYDVVDGGAEFRARLVGTAVYPGLIEDQTGKFVSEHPDPGVRLRFSAAMKQVLAAGEPVRTVSRRLTGTRLHDARTEGLWLPLGAPDGIEQILAGSSLHFVPPGHVAA